MGLYLFVWSHFHGRKPVPIPAFGQALLENAPMEGTPLASPPFLGFGLKRGSIAAGRSSLVMS
jgi:hypothetical protein